MATAESGDLYLHPDRNLAMELVERGVVDGTGTANDGRPELIGARSARQLPVTRRDRPITKLPPSCPAVASIVAEHSVTL